MRPCIILIAMFVAVGHWADFRATAAEPAAGAVKFTMHRVGNFRSESCGVGDFNKDGQLDIVAGSFVYFAPDWKPRQIRQINGEIDEQGKGYLWDFMNVPLDIDRDGLLDVVSCSWHGKQIEWYRNLGDAEGLWPVSVIEQNGNYECGDLWDIDGDGVEQEIAPAVKTTLWFEVGQGSDGQPTMLKHVVDEQERLWGVGVGDVNGDGRPDLLRPGAWFEAPANPRGGEWKTHPLAVGSETDGQADHTPQILVHDINGDGLADILTSVAHGHGIFWYQQIQTGGEPEWQRHTIDNTWSQAHSLTLADLDADGDLDLVTGKRFMAHNGNDPDGYGKLGVYWYELVPGRTVQWKKHIVSFDEGIGSGMNVPVVDLDGDGDLDIVVTGKWGGPVWFENTSE